MPSALDAKRSPSASEPMSSTLRCLQVFQALADPPYELSLTEIGARLRMVKGSAHRMVRTLAAAGLVDQDPRTKLYRLSPKAFWAGTAYLRNSPVYRAALPLLQSIAYESGLVVSLGAWHDRSLLYLNSITPPGLAHLVAEIGERWPVHSTALGKAMLAYRSRQEIDALTEVDRPRYTPKTIVSAAGIRQEARKTRARGYAVDDEEMIQGVRCVASPIFDSEGAAVAAISISGPVLALTNETVEERAALVREAATKVSMQLGYRPAARGRTPPAAL
ncbi:MAG: IclR family transcriptional regulator [Acidobacteria bacterium]|nr:IclR family transcriptional regulator [Acidobacteriota bacterium]